MKRTADLLEDRIEAWAYGLTLAALLLGALLGAGIVAGFRR